MRLCVALLTVLLFAPLAAAAEPLQVGFAEVDVTPELGKQPVYLAGFGQNRKATKVHDPITARAVFLADPGGATKVALVSVDVVGLFLPTVERIREQLPGFTYVLVSATHNHEGPDTLGLWGPGPFQSGVDPDYLKRVEDGCVEAARKAEKAAAPVGELRVGKASDPDLINDTRLPVVKHDELVTLRFVGPAPERKLLGVVVQWNCHPEVLDSKNTEITADFVYYTVKHLKAKSDCPVVYFTGTVGGLMTTIRLPVKSEDGRDLKDGTFEKSERYGTLVGKLAERAVANEEAVASLPLRAATRQFLVPVDNNLYRLGWQFGTLQRPLYVWDGNPTPKEFRPATDISKPVAVKTEIGHLRLGAVEVAVIPGEIYPELVLGKVQDPPDPGADFPDAPIEPAIYAQLKSKHRMLIGLGNDELGYIIPKRQWDLQPPFCYGLKKAQYGETNSVGPEAAPVICGVFRDLTGGIGRR
jgi:hypothetical protein